MPSVITKLILEKMLEIEDGTCTLRERFPIHEPLTRLFIDRSGGFAGAKTGTGIRCNAWPDRRLVRSLPQWRRLYLAGDQQHPGRGVLVHL